MKFNYKKAHEAASSWWLKSKTTNKTCFFFLRKVKITKSKIYLTSLNEQKQDTRSKENAFFTKCPGNTYRQTLRKPQITTVNCWEPRGITLLSVAATRVSGLLNRTICRSQSAADLSGHTQRSSVGERAHTPYSRHMLIGNTKVTTV